MIRGRKYIAIKVNYLLFLSHRYKIQNVVLKQHLGDWNCLWLDHVTIFWRTVLFCFEFHVLASIDSIWKSRKITEIIPKIPFERKEPGNVLMEVDSSGLRVVNTLFIFHSVNGYSYTPESNTYCSPKLMKTVPTLLEERKHYLSYLLYLFV